MDRLRGVFWVSIVLCCVESFVKGHQTKVFKKYPALPSGGSGFVPCLKCAALMQEDWRGFQQRIARSRRCQTPFPREPSDADLNRFFLFYTLELGFDPDEVLPTLRNSTDVKELWQTLKNTK